MINGEFRFFPECSYAVQEAFNSLCANLTFAGDDVKKVMITSSHAGEGKSFIAMNLMRTLAGLGHRVILVDADLRRSQIRSRYDLRVDALENRGLAHYLAGMSTADEVIIKTNIQNAYFISTGRAVKDSLKLIKNVRFSALLSSLAEKFDYVLVDAPPVGVIIDAAQIAQACDGTLIAVKYNDVSRAALRTVKEQIEKAGCPVLGAMLNDVELEKLGTKRYYGSNYYYYDDTYSNAPAQHRQRGNRHHKKKKESV